MHLYENYITVFGVFIFLFIYFVVEQRQLAEKKVFSYIYGLSLCICALWASLYPRKDPKQKQYEAASVYHHVDAPVAPPTTGPAPFYYDLRSIHADQLPANYRKRKFIVPQSELAIDDAFVAMEDYTGVSFGFCNSDLRSDFTIDFKSDTVTIGKFLSILRKKFGMEPVEHGHYLMFRRTKDWAVKNKFRYFEPVNIIPATVQIIP